MSWPTPCNLPPALPASGQKETFTMKSDLESDYGHLREEMERLMAEPVQDLPRIDWIIEALERLQLKLKAEQGIQGNNPNE